MCKPEFRDPQRSEVLDPLEQEMQAVVSCQMWVLEAKPKSSTKAE